MAELKELVRSAIQKFTLSSNNYAEVFRNQKMNIQYKHDILNIIIMKIIMVMILRSRLNMSWALTMDKLSGSLYIQTINN